MPEDGYGRNINYLRLSLIDNCNLRCVYCMPLEGLTFVSAPELLTPEEFATVARADEAQRRTISTPLLLPRMAERVVVIGEAEGAA